MTITHEQYALYSRIFDDIVALRRHDDRNHDVTLYGSIAGAALRTWAATRGFDVEPETLENDILGVSWTVLRVTIPKTYSTAIAVHLDDCIPQATAPIVTVDEATMEIPF